MPNPFSNIPQSFRRAFGKLILAGGLLALTSLLLITGCQSSLIYFPHRYPPGLSAKWAQQTPGKTIDFTTSQGPQRAFLQGHRHNPRYLWLVCGGNGSVALDWSKWLLTNAPPEDAYLLVDFPGYGDCAGSPSPATIRETFTKLVPLASHELAWPANPDSARLRVFGHSLGAAACLIAAADYHIQRGVLLAPFTSTMAMARHLTGLPLEVLVRHRFDNVARLGELTTHGAAHIIIVHGVRDEVIPVTMSRQLANQYPATVELREIAGGHHNSIQAKNPAELSRAIHDAAQ